MVFSSMNKIASLAVSGTVIVGLPTQDDCTGPFPAEFPDCQAKIDWMVSNWQKYASYAEKGVDGSRCSIQQYLNTEEGGPDGYCPPVNKDSDFGDGAEFEDSVYEYDSSVGEWGATCQCPDGSTYAVGDLGDRCVTYACYGGDIIDSCEQNSQREGARMKVTCGQSTGSSIADDGDKDDDVVVVPVEPPTQNNNVYEYASSVGEWGATCQCPDGNTYAVGDLGDRCGTYACYGGVIIDSCEQKSQREGARMKVVCEGFQEKDDDDSFDTANGDGGEGVQINVVTLNVYGYATMPGAADTYAEYIVGRNADVVGIQEGANDWKLPSGQLYPSDYSRSIAMLNSLNEKEPLGSNCWQREYQIFINTCKGLSAIEAYRFDLTNGPQATRTGETMKISINGKRFAFVNIHWENSSADVRESNSQETTDQVNALRGDHQVVITVGDFNTGCTSYQANNFKQHTSSVEGAYAAIDCIFVTGSSFEQPVVGSFQGASPSDHPLVWANIRLF